MTIIPQRRGGIALVTASAVLWSTAGLFVRWADLDTWSMVFWRSIFSVLALGTAYLFQRRRGGVLKRSLKLSAPEWISVAVTVVSTVAYVLALELTTVANVMTIYAALPFIATGFAYLWVGERVTRRFLMAGAIALAAIALMAGGIATVKDLWGVAAALVMTCGFAIQLVHTKRHQSLDMLLVLSVGAALCIPISAIFIHPALPSLGSLLACALYGMLTTGLAYVLALQGGRLISSGEAGLISMLDVVLGPLWVWIIFSEHPSTTTLASGFVVLGAVLWYLGTSRQTASQKVAAS
jgi:drug/metabolite transporter (DMT)-like permease